MLRLSVGLLCFILFFKSTPLQTYIHCTRSSPTAICDYTILIIIPANYSLITRFRMVTSFIWEYVSSQVAGIFRSISHSLVCVCEIFVHFEFLYETFLVFGGLYSIINSSCIELKITVLDFFSANFANDQSTLIIHSRKPTCGNPLVCWCSTPR